MKTIVVPTDFSEISLNAANYAADMACMVGANVALIHVYMVAMPLSDLPAAVNYLEGVEVNAREQIEELKEKLLYRTGERIIIHTEVRSGNVLSEITGYCDIIKPYAVIMGSQGATAAERFFLGSHCVAAMKHLEWPLITVPPKAKFLSIKKVGLACDFRKVIESVRIQEIKAFIEDFAAELHVLHVSDENDGTFSDEMIEESGWLQEILADLKPSYHFLKGLEIEKTISDYAEKNKLDILLIIPKKHSLWSKLFQESHSKRLLLQTRIPVMTIHE